MYIEVELTLDSLDLIQIENLIDIRIKTLNDLKATEDVFNSWYLTTIADEQINNYRSTLKKIEQARAEVKRVKEVGDAAYFAGLNPDNRG
jgi:hypothetical protein